MLAVFTGCGQKEEISDTERDVQNMVKEITVNTTIRKTGQYPENIVVTFENDITNTEVPAASFHMEGEAGYWGSDGTRDFEADFESVAISKNKMTLIPASFPEKYFYVNDFNENIILAIF